MRSRYRKRKEKQLRPVLIGIRSNGKKDRDFSHRTGLENESGLLWGMKMAIGKKGAKEEGNCDPWIEMVRQVY
jgi:hypothetical protein